jgi:GlpG protein
MRRIGFIDDSTLATRFCDYLITLGISATAESTEDSGSATGQHAIWVKEEPKVDQAKAELALFLKSPKDQKYSVSGEAAKRRTALEEENRRRLKNQKTVQNRSVAGFGAAGRPMVTFITIAICCIAGFITNFGSPRPIVTPEGRLAVSSQMIAFDKMTFLSRTDARASDDAFASIRKGEVWRVITPAILHGSIGHLAMNMFGIFILGGAIERIQGRFIITLLLVVTAIAGTVIQAIWPEANNGGPGGIGASGAAYGLFGYLLVRPFHDDSYPISLPPTAAIMGLMFLLLGLAMVIPNIANGAHVGGLVAGMILAKLIPAQGRGRAF